MLGTGYVAHCEAPGQDLSAVAAAAAFVQRHLSGFLVASGTLGGNGSAGSTPTWPKIRATVSDGCAPSASQYLALSVFSSKCLLPSFSAQSAPRFSADGGKTVCASGPVDASVGVWQTMARKLSTSRLQSSQGVKASIQSLGSDVACSHFDSCSHAPGLGSHVPRHSKCRPVILYLESAAMM